jgi:hypothetical protein
VDVVAAVVAYTQPSEAVQTREPQLYLPAVAPKMQ